MRVPTGVRSQLWLSHNGKNFSASCKCCATQITVFDFQGACIVPQAKGTRYELTNLLPVCKSCAHSSREVGISACKTKHSSVPAIQDLQIGLQALSPEDLKKIATYASDLLTNPEPVLAPVKPRRNRRVRAAEAPPEGAEVTGECKYKYVRGGNKGNVCSEPVYDGAHFCAQCRNKYNAANQLAEIEGLAPTGDCKYKFTKGNSIGKPCGEAVFDGNHFCVRCRTKKAASTQLTELEGSSSVQA